MAKILHFSPVRKPAQILELHLQGLKGSRSNHEVVFSFFDDNTEEESSQLLEDFLKSFPKAFKHSFNVDSSPNYQGKERWVPDLYTRISSIKNQAIEYFLKTDFDFLFLTDSDLIIHPKTIDQLVSEREHFCSMIFWTRFGNKPLYTPNAWFSKPRGFDKNDLISFRDEERIRVDFTGACTLLSKKILEDGVTFQKIPNVEYLGEDKHFCIRAAVMGYLPVVSTIHPAFHVYDESYIEEGTAYIRNGFSSNYLNYWLDEKWENQIDEFMKATKLSILKKYYRKIKG